MGRPNYDSDRATTTSLGYNGLRYNQIFSNSLNPELDPKGVIIRESRDSDNHPNSKPIIIGLDMTGSMYIIPHRLITEDLNNLMVQLLENNITDPQVMFMGIGDHKCDYAPLQISQFESDDENLDKWLKGLWIEGHGGGNDGESYLLSWYFAAKKTSIDSMEKRNAKGFLFTIGDEKTHKTLPSDAILNIFGDQEEQTSAEYLFEAASEKYNVFHIHVREGNNGKREDVIEDWRNLIGKNLIIVDTHTEIPEAVFNAITSVNSTDNSITPGIVGGANLIITE